MSKEKNDDDFEGPVIPRHKFFGRNMSYVCSSCLRVKEKNNELHREFKTHKLYEWQVVGKKILCARCVCALFAPGDRTN
jgi:hypothetical protein